VGEVLLDRPRKYSAGFFLKERLLGDFVADYFEADEPGATESGGEGTVGGIAAYGHEDAADAGDIVAGIEGPPAIA
jgi:hypothetical protein